ncbi:S8 family peptidase [Streptomyces antibioticus]|uniref:S8 family peptidase n=1 Tax=Streptomyces antibioticus TaxID=1890 RepID=UPI0037A6EFA2
MLRSGLTACAALSALTATTIAPSPAQAADAAPVERWIVQLKDTVADPRKAAEEQIKGQGQRVESRLRHVYDATAGGVALKGYALEATAEQIEAIRADPQVAGVERDRTAHLTEPVKGTLPQIQQERTGRPASGGVPYAGDPLLAGQWGLFRIGAVAGAHDGFVVPPAARVGVAVLDTGIDANHPDLRIAGSANFTGAPTADDFVAHGTHVAGIVQALNNTTGVESTAPGTRLWNVKVINDDGSMATSDLIAGLNWVAQNARANNIRVANLSLRAEADNPLLHEAVQVVTRSGVAVVVAAGNDGTTQLNYPAAYPEVISVAATTVFNQKADFSNYGAATVDLAAPGQGILSTFPSHPTSKPLNYGYEDGTSMAAPFVSGTAALCLSSGHCKGDTDSVLRRLAEDSLPVAGTGTEFRYGLVQAACYWQRGLKCSR